MRCMQVVEASFNELVTNPPKGKIAMFEINGVPSSMDADRWLGAYVYGTKKGRLIDIYTHRFVQTPTSIKFVRYVDWN